MESGRGGKGQSREETCVCVGVGFENDSKKRQPPILCTFSAHSSTMNGKL